MAHIESFRAEEIAEKFALLAPTMDERQTRLWLAAEAKAIGRGGIAAVTRATGVLGKRIGMGIRELDQLVIEPPQEPPDSQRIRRPGAGRKKLTDADATLVEDLESLIAPETRGDPESLLRLTTKSQRGSSMAPGPRGLMRGKRTMLPYLSPALPNRTRTCV